MTEQSPIIFFTSAPKVAFGPERKPVELVWQEIDGNHPAPNVRACRPGRWASFPDGSIGIVRDPLPRPR